MCLLCSTWAATFPWKSLGLAPVVSGDSNNLCFHLKNGMLLQGQVAKGGLIAVTVVMTIWCGCNFRYKQKLGHSTVHDIINGRDIVLSPELDHFLAHGQYMFVENRKRSMWIKCHSVRRALLLHRHKCGTTSVLTMYMSMVYKSDLFKIELDIKRTCRKDWVLVKTYSQGKRSRLYSSIDRGHSWEQRQTSM